MKRNLIIAMFILFSTFIEAKNDEFYLKQKSKETIFVWGGDINLKFTQYVRDLKICC